jgi:septum formation protein
MTLTAIDKGLRLASASPRRRDLLHLGGWEFSLHPAEVDETPGADEAPEAVALRLAQAKAAAAPGPAGSLTLGADTIVVLEDCILGKPHDRDEARRMLHALRGRTHRVLTGLALSEARGDVIASELCATDVMMRRYTDAQVEAYLESGAPMDKAGAYGIQDDGFNPVDLGRMTGCFANVMGLPLCHAARALAAQGRPSPLDIPQACRRHTGYACTVFPQILGREL